MAAEAPASHAAETAQEQDRGVVGAGPAGLAAAYYLALEGYPVTIYEALPEGYGGGMIAVGIPAYRQPRHLLQRDIDIICSMGVEIVYNTRVGKDISLAELKQKHDAVFLAPGAHRSKPMGVEGEDKGYKGFLKGGIDFLREAYHGHPDRHGEKGLRCRRRQHRHRLRPGCAARRGRGIDPALPPLPQGDARRRLGS